jgi:hypothetical protein
MQRGLKIAIAVAALLIAGLVARRAFRAAHVGSLSPGSEPFWYADVDRSVAAIGPDPRSSGGVLDVARERHGRACEGEPAAIEAVLSSIRGALGRGEDRDEVRRGTVALARQCFDGAVDIGLCDWAAREVDASGDLADIGWAVLAACPSPLAAPYFDRAEAPAIDVLAFVASRAPGYVALEPPPRLPSQYARAVLERAALDPSPAAMIGGLGERVRYEDAAATEVLSIAFETAPDRARRAAIGRALGVLSDPRARAAARVSCMEERRGPPELCDTEGSLDTTLRILDSASYVLRHPAERELVLAQLEACARGPDGDAPFIAICLRDVAELDWNRARVIAADLGTSGWAVSRLSGSVTDPSADAFVATLARFPSRDALALTLRSRGLLGAPRPTSRPPVTIGQTMVAHGRGWSLADASPYGGGHDRLARHLARLAGGVLDDVSFDEILPDRGEVLPFPRSMELVAYARSERFATLTSSDGDLYDLSAVVGLLNVLLRERGSDLRYVVVEDPFVEELVVVGSAPALLSAIAEDLLHVAPPDAL